MKKGINNININMNNKNNTKNEKTNKNENNKNKKCLPFNQFSKSNVNTYNRKKNFKSNTVLIKTQKSKLIDSEFRNYHDLNIQEMNVLKYKEAIFIDKRTYCQYYLSLIRKKQLIIFTFVPIDDYNLVSLKISLFLLSFSLYMTVNAFFFDDKTMHEIYINKGKMNLKLHFPHIVYSAVISTVINIILKQLSLSENSILSIKQIKTMNKTYIKAKEIKDFLRIKFIIYFIISFLLSIFYWYFISCFCAVYKNTQVILIKDSLFSFGISMFYPFAINLLPGIFRIPSLRAKNKDKKCTYRFSQLLSLL